MQKEWATGVSGNPKNFGVKIISHEKTQAHLDASMVVQQPSRHFYLDLAKTPPNQVIADFGTGSIVES